MHRDFRGVVALNSSSRSLKLFDIIVTNHDLVIKGAMFFKYLQTRMGIISSVLVKLLGVNGKYCFHLGSRLEY